MYGYGLTGTGTSGEILGTTGTKRHGENRWEALLDQIDSTESHNLLVYDFDNGNPANDALGALLGIHDTGLGLAEANSARGDSGGPNFLDGKIAGIVTGGAGVPATDVTPITDSSFGEISFDTRVSAYATWIDAVVASGGGAEFIVNQITTGMQQWSSVALDADGDFVVTWTSYGQDGAGNGYGAGANGLNGVYARRFTSDGNASSGDFRVNTTTANNQQHSKAAMDADGDFVIAWESFQDRPSSNLLPDSPNSYGIYAQRYASTAKLGTAGYLGANGEMGSEFRLNTTTDGNQRYPSVSLDATGDLIAVWSGNGTQTNNVDPQGVFMRRYSATKDVAGPFVTDVLRYSSNNGVGTLTPIYNDTILTGSILTFVICFDENLSIDGGPGGLHSVQNLSNWQLAQNGTTLLNGVVSVKFDGVKNDAHVFDTSLPFSNKYEVVVTFDLDSTVDGNQPLGPGQYTLTLLDYVQDVLPARNALDGNLDGTPGGNFVFSFSIPTSEQIGPQLPPTTTPVGPPPATYTDNPVNTTKVGTQDNPAVASNSSGDHVIVWVSTPTTAGADVMFQKYDRNGKLVGTETLASSISTGDQVEPDVAMDNMGNFVVVWSGYGSDASGVDDSGVWGRLFDTTGKALGDQFRINPSIGGVQDMPRVAMDANGDFVVTWSGYNGVAAQETDKDGVYARRYNKLGQALGNEFLVNSYTKNRQDNSDVAIDTNGNFVIVWQSDQQDGGSWGIYGQRYNSAGLVLGGEFRVNNYTSDTQFDPHVAMDAGGDFTVSWTSFNQDGSGYGVYARRYNAAGAALDANEFRVNQNALNWQYQSAVSCDYNGDFVVTWTTYGQESEIVQDYGIFARMYRANGSDWLDPSTNLPFGEFRINAIIVGNQVSSDVAMDSDGDFVVAWVGADSDSTGIYSRILAINSDTYTQTTSQSSTAQYNTGTTNTTQTTANQAQSFVLSGPTSGTFTSGQAVQITWTAGGVQSGSLISLCYDEDTKWGNGNEHWIEIDQVSAINNGGTYTWDTTKVASGTYYISGYMWDKGATFTKSHLTTSITIPGATTTATTANQAQSFVLTSPTSGTFTSGQAVQIAWTAGGVKTGSLISLCYDEDTKWGNGNEHWIEIDQVSADNSGGTYTWDTTKVAPGTYYLGGYMWDKGATFTKSHLTTSITIPGATTTATTANQAQSFVLSGPTSGTFTSGQAVQITWTAGGVQSGSLISLCYDEDTKWGNGNEHWIEIDQVSAINNGGTYTWDTTKVAPGTYYMGGYMWDKGATFTKSHLTTSITIPGATTTATTANQAQSFVLTSPTSGTFTSGQAVQIAWTAGGVKTGSLISLCYDEDTKWGNGNEHWIEIDQVSADNSGGTYTWDTTKVAPGTYYLGGYMWDKGATFTKSHLTTSITIPAQSFVLTGPTSGTFSPGQAVQITWTAGGVKTGSLISLCYDEDTKWGNGNEHWIEIDQVSAVNSGGSYTWNTTKAAPGTYYISGYLWDGANAFSTSHLFQSISISSSVSTDTKSGTNLAMKADVQGTKEDLSNKDYGLNALELKASDSSAVIALVDAMNEDDAEKALALRNKVDELAAIDLILQDQDAWLEGASSKSWVAA